MKKLPIFIGMYIYRSVLSSKKVTKKANFYLCNFIANPSSQIITFLGFHLTLGIKLTLSSTCA